MNDGAKIGLILGGTAAVAYFLFFRTSSTVPLAATPTTTAGAPLGASPGAPISTGVPTAVKSISSVVGGFLSTDKKILGTAASTIYNVDKKVLGTTYSAAKSVVSGVGSVASSAFHGIASIF